MKKSLELKVTNNFNEYLTLLVALNVVSGGTIYYIYALNWLGIILSLTLVIVGFIFFRRNHQTLKITPSLRRQDWDKKDYVLLAAYGLAYLTAIIILIMSRSDRALISPWQVVNHSFFWLYGLISLILILILNKEKLTAGIKIFLISSYYFLSFSVALIIYKIAYGFDPFIHQATMELIALKGLVLPKPPYYLGEYGLIVIISKISGLSIYFLNKILVPLLSACLLPPTLYRFLVRVGNNEANNKSSIETSQNFLTILFLLILSSSLFTLTTPQNLSYLFLILTVLTGLSPNNLWRVFLLALATAVIHPLTGLPALSWAAWLIFKKYQNRLKVKTQKISRIVIWLTTALTLPLALVIAGGGGRSIAISWSSLLESLKKLGGTLGSAGREDWLLNFVYFLTTNYNFLLILAIAIILLYFYRRGAESDENRAITTNFIFINSGLLTAYILSSQIHFTELIDYEQTAYAQRIPIIMVIFSLPFLIYGLKQLITKIGRSHRLEKGLWLIFGLGILTASLYLSYPRFDKYWNSRGYSTSVSDIVAVKSINEDAKGSYLVLANQQVSAAALAEFGFDHYYQTPQGPLYFYPIPTGGPLYQYYLDMVYKNPSQSNLKGACNLAGVNFAYLVINKYWYQSGRLINEAKLTAANWWTINNEVYIFKYHCQTNDND